MRSHTWKVAALRDLAGRLERWFETAQRPLPWRERYDPFHVWVSEVMLQQTRMEVVLGRFARFIERFPSVAALACSTEEDVLAEWSGLGYYRRARMLRQGCRRVRESFGGEMPRTLGELRTIPGIGRYTAGAILSIAFDQPAAIVDGNVARVLARVFALAGDVASSPVQREIWKHSEELVGLAESPRNFNQAMMELGATVCKPQLPECGQCPVENLCLARRGGMEREIPPPGKRAATVSLVIPLWIVRNECGHLLLRLHRGRLMNEMFHLPQGSSALLGQEAESFIVTRLLGAFRHTVTNRRIRFDVYEAAMPDAINHGAGYQWVAPDDLHTVPHSSYVRKALDLARVV